MSDNLVTRPTSRSKARTPDDLIRLLRGEECDDCVNNFCTCDVIERAADCIEAQAKRIEQLEEALTIALSALVAATSLLKRSEDEKVKPSRAVASNKIFRLMMADYERAEDNARAALLGEKE